MDLRVVLRDGLDVVIPAGLFAGKALLTDLYVLTLQRVKVDCLTQLHGLDLSAKEGNLA